MPSLPTSPCRPPPLISPPPRLHRRLRPPHGPPRHRARHRRRSLSRLLLRQFLAPRRPPHTIGRLQRPLFRRLPRLAENHRLAINPSPNPQYPRTRRPPHGPPHRLRRQHPRPGPRPGRHWPLVPAQPRILQPPIARIDPAHGRPNLGRHPNALRRRRRPPPPRQNRTPHPHEHAHHNPLHRAHNAAHHDAIKKPRSRAANFQHQFRFLFSSLRPPRLCGKTSFFPAQNSQFSIGSTFFTST